MEMMETMTMMIGMDHMVIIMTLIIIGIINPVFVSKNYWDCKSSSCIQ